MVPFRGGTSLLDCGLDVGGCNPLSQSADASWFYSGARRSLFQGLGEPNQLHEVENTQKQAFKRPVVAALSNKQVYMGKRSHLWKVGSWVNFDIFLSPFHIFQFFYNMYFFFFLMEK